MSSARTMFFACLLLVALDVPALAQRGEPPGPIIQLGTVLASPPLTSEGGFECSVVNVSSHDTFIGHVKIVNLTGSFGTDATGCQLQTLAPRGLCGIQSPSFNPLIAYCEITLLGNADAVRGALTGFRLRNDVFFPQTVEAH